jgi:hypothetical protein
MEYLTHKRFLAIARLLALMAGHGFTFVEVTDHFSAPGHDLPRGTWLFISLRDD